MKIGLSQFLEDNDGGFSATRLAFLLWTICVLIAWLYLSITGGELKGIPQDVVAIVGVLTTGKVIQRFGENSTQSASPPAKTPVKPIGGVDQGEDIRE